MTLAGGARKPAHLNFLWGLPMFWNRFNFQIGVLTLCLAGAMAMSACQVISIVSEGEAETPGMSQNDDNGVAIQTESDLPDTSLHASYEFHLTARGRPPFQWRVMRGAPPPGIQLDENGLLHGAAERAGEFQFTVTVRDNEHRGVEKQLILRVRAAQSQHDENEILIQSESDLPDTSPHANYLFHLIARGTPPFHWHVERGALPPGIQLDDSGVLHGAAERAGEFQFTASIRDGEHRGVEKQFIIRVHAALVLIWKNAARVNGNRIEGSVEVSNTSADDIDLTFVVMAVAILDSRGTAIGYQHFLLRRGTTGKEIPFGETLPHGGYVIHVDAVGEVAPKNLIYRERMETPGALQVTVGP